MKKSRKRLAKRLEAQEIRIDEHNTIKLRTSRWFPELVVLTGLLATAGTYMYGKQIGSLADLAAQSASEDAAVLSAHLEIEQEKALESEIVPVVALKTFAAAPRPKASLNPRIIEASANNRAISVDLDSAKIVGDEAVITYRIHNRGHDEISGSTWAGNAQKSEATHEKLPWQAKRFTIKQVSVPAEAGEVKIFVSANGAGATNAYLVTF